MNKTALCIAALSALLASGCAADQAYVTMQDYARDDCYKRPDVDRAACLQRISVKFDAYTKQRETFINTPAK